MSSILVLDFYNILYYNLFMVKDYVTYQEKIKALRLERDARIVALVKKGVTFREIAALEHITYQRVHQIVNAAREKEDEFSAELFPRPGPRPAVKPETQAQA